MEHSTIPDPPVARLRRTRWITPALLVLLCIIAIIAILLSDGIEGNYKFPYVALSIALTLLFTALWFLLFSGLRWTTRLVTLAAGALVLFGGIFFLRKTTRIEGSYTGAGVARLVWKWSPKRDALTEPEAAAAARPVADLKTVSPQDFPQFLGPSRDGHLHDVHLARDWTTFPPQLIWRRPIGAGWSGFAIVGNAAVTIEQRGQQELTACYDLKTGKVLWQHGNPVRFSESMGGDGPRTTPTIDGGNVYAFGATGILDCLDGATGKLLWSRNVLDEYSARNLDYGKSGSPLIVDRFVVVTGGAPAGPSLVAYDKQTGEPAWHGGTNRPGYASPVLATVAGVRQILSVNAESLAGFDPADGHVLWETHWAGQTPKASQAVPIGNDRVYSSTGYGIGSILVQVQAAGTGLKAVELWHTPVMKTEFTNVIARNGFVYGLDDGTLICQDFSTGKRKWRGSRYGHGQMLLAGDVLVIQTEDGAIALVEATPDGQKELGRFAALTGKTWNTPALAGHVLLVRNDQEAACYRLP